MLQNLVPKSLVTRTQALIEVNKLLDSQNVVLTKVQIENISVINSQFGREAGNKLIRIVTDVLLGLPDAFSVAEISPALYAIVSTDWRHPKQILKKIQESVLELNRKDSFPFLVELSAGATVIDKAAVRSENQWFDEANMALLYSSRSGEPQVYHENTGTDSIIRGIFGRLAETDVPPEGMYWVYQPINSTVDGSVFAYEALCRWEVPGIGLISPEVFIPIAEETGVIEIIDRWGLMNLQASHEQLFSHGGHCVSFNLSAKTLESDRSFADLIKVILQRNHDCGCELIIEMTETAVATNRGRLLAQLHDLRSHGVRIAIDDFGSGLTSLGSLADVPCDYLKVDASLLHIKDSHMARGLLEISKKLADLLGAKVIVEGVETLDEFNLVKAAGADYVQGWYFGQPIDPREIAHLE